MKKFEIWGDITREEDYDERDYSLAWAWDIKIPDLRRPAFNKVWLLDQWIDDYTKWACVPINCYIVICFAWNLRPDWKYFLTLLKDLEKDWLRKPWVWASLPKVMDWMRRRWNKDFVKYPVVYYRDEYTDPIVYQALLKWYQLPVRYWVTLWYSRDRDDNLIIDKTSYWEAEKYGHIVKLTFSKAFKWKTLIAFHPNKEDKEVSIPNKWDWFYIFDQYPFIRSKSNIYQINTLKDLIKNWIYSPWVYTVTRKV